MNQSPLISAMLEAELADRTKASNARIATLEAMLREAGEAMLRADNELAWATCMMAEGVEFYTLREVFHAAQKDAMKAHQTLKAATTKLDQSGLLPKVQP